PSPSALRRGRRRVRTAALGQELIELGLVLGKAQAVEEAAELALFLFEPAQGIGAVLVEGAIAAAVVPPAPAASSLVAPLIVPAAIAAMSPATHSSTPDEKGQERKAHRPEQDEARDRQGDPGRLADIVQSRRDPHSCSPRCKCYLHSHKWAAAGSAVKRGRQKNRQA